MVDYRQLDVGDALPPFTTAPVSRLTLALYCGASGDHNPMHVDIDFARAGGASDVFAHGMLSMAYLGRLLTTGCRSSTCASTVCVLSPSPRWVS